MTSSIFFISGSIALIIPLAYEYRGLYRFQSSAVFDIITTGPSLDIRYFIFCPLSIMSMILLGINDVIYSVSEISYVIFNVGDSIFQHIYAVAKYEDIEDINISFSMVSITGCPTVWKTAMESG